jgi:hypothetical protein
MMRAVTVWAIVMILLVGATSVGAHDDFRIIGTLMKHENSTIEVKNKAGKTISIRLDKQTAISRDNKKVAASELRVGQSLVVDAYGDTEDDSLALEIRIVPPIRAGGA